MIALFENRSGESVLERTLEYALERELSNSTFPTVVPRERVSDTLALMQGPLDTSVDRVLAREMCLRNGGIRALGTGGVTKLQTAYVPSATIVDPKSGVAVASVSQATARRAEVLAAVRLVSRQVRQELGEELPRMSSCPDRLEKAPTASLRDPEYFSIRRYTGGNLAPDWSPDGRYLAYASRKAPLFREPMQ